MRIGLFFGGRSQEHDISTKSAKNIGEILCRMSHDVVYIGIDVDGLWHLSDSACSIYGTGLNGAMICQEIFPSLDLCFPVLHGLLGEDGSIQGLFEMFGVPYVGSSILGSAVGMDKDVSKRIVREAGIAVAHFFPFNQEPSLEKVLSLGMDFPMFIKPANGGSSLGVSRVTSAVGFYDGIKEAFKYDDKILVERAIIGKEIECGILETQYDVMVSLPGEIALLQEMHHTYQTKYFHSNNAIIPPRMSEKKIQEIQQTALHIFKVLSCDGIGRVDLFVDSTGRIYFNEINTMPGCVRDVSPFLSLWEKSEFNECDVMNILMQFAFYRFRKKNRIYNQ